MNRDDALSGAGDLINGQRSRDYGDARTNFRDIAKLWSPILGIEVEPWQVALCMNQLKVARLFKTPTHVDSWMDGVGYLALGCELATEDVPEGHIFGDATLSTPNAGTHLGDVSSHWAALLQSGLIIASSPS